MNDDNIFRDPGPRLIRRKRRRRITREIEPGSELQNSWDRVHQHELADTSMFGKTEIPGPTSELVRGLRAFIRDREIHSIVDVGCGAMEWWDHVIGDTDTGAIQFTGYDICAAKIDICRKKYRSRPDRRFHVGDARMIDIPQADLVICRRTLNHLWFTDAVMIRRNLSKRSKLVAFTHDPTLRVNRPDGMRLPYAPDCPRATRFTPMNLRRPPFMPMPVVLNLQDIEEQYLSFFPGRVIE